MIAKLPSLLFFSLLLSEFASAHLVMICTSTSPTEPGVAALWFGNYHYPAEHPNVDGYVKFTSPEGVTRSFPWNTYCEGLGSYSENDYTTFAADLKNPAKTAPCTTLADSYGRPYVKDDSTVNCYVYNPTTGTHEFAVAGQNLACPSIDTSVETPMPNQVNSWFVVPVTDLSSGYYRVEAYTSHIFVSALYDYPCAIVTITTDPSYARLFPIVFYGSGSSCNSAPPANSTENVDPSSLVTCNGSAVTIPSGFVCPAQCEPGYTATDLLSCVNGQWNSDFKCTAKKTCGAISLDANHDQSIPSNIQGVTGENCIAFTEAGVYCSPVCADGAEAYGSVLCGSDGLWTNVDAQCVHANPSPDPSPEASPQPSPDASPAPTRCVDADESLSCDMLFSGDSNSNKLCNHKLHDGRLIRDLCPQSCNCCSFNGQCLCNQDDQVTAIARQYGIAYDATCEDALQALGTCNDIRFARRMRQYCPCLCPPHANEVKSSLDL